MEVSKSLSLLLSLQFQKIPKRSICSLESRLEEILEAIKSEIFWNLDKARQEKESDCSIKKAIVELIKDKIKEIFQVSCPLDYEDTIHFYLENFIKQWRTKKSDEVLKNVWDASFEDCFECICRSVTQTSVLQQFCYRCGNMRHPFCFWPKQKDNLFECPFCFIRFCQPNKQVQSIIFASYIEPKAGSSHYQFEVQWPQNILYSNKYEVELRCVRFDYQNRYELAWPQFCDIFINENLIASVKPLPPNSPLKRRHDEPIKLYKDFIELKNTFKISEYSTNCDKNKSWHLLTVNVIKERKQLQIFHELRKQILSIQSSKNYLAQLFEAGQNQLKVDAITISNKCQFYGGKIKYAARSKMCLNHYQPFDLMNFVYSSVNAQSSSRKWKCPICGVRAYDIQVDSLITTILLKNQSTQEIIFPCMGIPAVVEEEEEVVSLSMESEEKQETLNCEASEVSHKKLQIDSKREEPAQISSKRIARSNQS